MTPEDALANNVTNGQIVQVKVLGTRPLIFDDVVIRVSPHFATYMHIDMMKQTLVVYQKVFMVTSLSKRRLDNESF